MIDSRPDHGHTYLVDQGADDWVLRAAEELGIDPQTAVQLEAADKLVDALRRSRLANSARLEPSIAALPGLPAWTVCQRVACLPNGRPLYASREIVDWLADPIGPFHAPVVIVRALLDGCEAASPARAELIAALWEAQDD